MLDHICRQIIRAIKTKPSFFGLPYRGPVSIYNVCFHVIFFERFYVVVVSIK